MQRWKFGPMCDEKIGHNSTTHHTVVPSPTTQVAKTKCVGHFFFSPVSSNFTHKAQNETVKLGQFDCLFASFTTLEWFSSLALMTHKCGCCWPCMIPCVVWWLHPRGIWSTLCA